MIIGIENGHSESTVQAWIDQFNWTFRVGINDPVENPIYSNYEDFHAYDTWYVIDREGTIKLRERPSNDRFDFPLIYQAVDAALATVPVKSTTWARVKRLWTVAP